MLKCQQKEENNDYRIVIDNWSRGRGSDRGYDDRVYGSDRGIGIGIRD